MDKKLLLLRKKLSSKEILGNRKYCVLCDLWRFMREEKSNVLRKVWEGNQRQCKVLSILWKQSFGKSGIPPGGAKANFKRN